MINQPELGKKLIELRKKKGLTQEDLVEKCNLSVRTLQRIESGEVTPRNTTIKLIFEALELSSTIYFESIHENDKELKYNWFNQLYISFIGLFYLRTNTIKKITILIIILSAIIISSYIVSRALSTQSKPVKQIPRSTGVRIDTDQE
ncbi:MAG: helix-turn-helix transcriptional regulator [Bacteroidales bacterium]|nr:helix-turn-helix transcriptional regulator [Bacteroidales bacterium]